MKKIVFAPLTKVRELDDGTVEIFARAVEETPDPKNELFDYASSKPLIQAWSDGIHKASGGKSLGNLRAMHNAKLAAGKLTEITFLDEQKAMDIIAKVVDPVEVQKVREGVYTGISIGGDYARKWQDGPYMRYTARPSEFSLADNPMIKTCCITLVKVDGSEAEMELGKVKTPELSKSMWAVAQFAQLLGALNEFKAGVDWEVKAEGDASPIPAQLKAVVDNLGRLLVAYTQEEVDELSAEDLAAGTGLAMAAETAALAGGTPALQKVGAAISAKNKDHAQQIHDHAAALGATCGGESMKKLAEAETLAKVAALEADIAAKDEELAKVAGEKDAALAQVAEKDEELAKVAGEKAALQTEVDELKKQPAPAKGSLREGLHAPSKKEDALEKTAAVKEPETPLEAVKLAHQKPFIMTR
jgi:hypothetical protein